MKRIIVVGLMLCFCATLSSAQLLIGSRAGGMGGAGVASSTDLAAAYYNPAALMRSDVKLAKLQVSAGAAYTDLASLSNTLASAGSPAQFLTDNYSKNLNFSGGLSGIVGLNIRKIGISIIPVGSANVNKAADTFVGSVAATGEYATVVTLGKTFNAPFLPAALDVGINIKSITSYRGNIVTTGTTLSASGTREYDSGTGTGFDIGLLTSFNIPLVTELKVGFAARNLAQSVTYSRTTQRSYVDQSTLGTVTTETAVNLVDSKEEATPAYVLGASAVVPGINLLMALDVESVGGASNTHLGFEYPIFLNRLILRAGQASGPGLAKTTIGAKIDLFLLNLDIVSVSDANNAGTTSFIVDSSIGW